MEQQLKKYAELFVRAGGNVQPGQLVVISCAADNAYFGRMVAEAAYDAGAQDVRMDWVDDQSTRMRFLRADDKVFDTFADWRVAKLKEQDDAGAVYLHISSPDPDLLAGVEPKRIMRQTKVSRQATLEHTAIMMSSALRWSVVAIASPIWAKKVFPDLSETAAVEKLWTHILKCARADGENPLADWEQHCKNFAARVEFLNKSQFVSLRITTGIGTNLTLGLVKNHIWAGGGDRCKQGLEFLPNIPTEEIFTMPHKNHTTGRVVASMPLSYQGNLIEGFEMTFADGKVVEYGAAKNQETLKNMVDMDEGARRLGEVALVANSSPIGQMNTLYYNTLYDENASSHLALGKAYPKNLEGGDALSADELGARGANDSLIHVDFMFGTPDMCVVGIKEDGSEVKFFADGEFVGI